MNRTTINRASLAVGAIVLAVTLAVLAANDEPADAGTDPASGACLVGTVDCVDTPGIVVGEPAPGQEEEPAGDVYDSESARAEAKALLGLTDAELAPDVRISRRGEEEMMLTEDYVLGRMTVELDINDMDEWIVTAVTVELPDGPESFVQHLP
ncbi:MAG: hypothetical protein R3343_10575 [Nitriliruptorales bacterium]|nr:hypothetical protein [Nitriliruptorales bacterium]